MPHVSSPGGSRQARSPGPAYSAASASQAARLAATCSGRTAGRRPAGASCAGLPEVRRTGVEQQLDRPLVHRAEVDLDGADAEVPPRVEGARDLGLVRRQGLGGAGRPASPAWVSIVMPTVSSSVAGSRPSASQAAH